MQQWQRHRWQHHYAWLHTCSTGVLAQAKRHLSSVIQAQPCKHPPNLRTDINHGLPRSLHEYRISSSALKFCHVQQPALPTAALRSWQLLYPSASMSAVSHVTPHVPAAPCGLPLLHTCCALLPRPPPPQMTVDAVKAKVNSMTGTSVLSMTLHLQDESGRLVDVLQDGSRKLGYYSPRDG
eukprot:GHRQ01034815.1.p1 GENE.GHRQ01034815.1~~GHRQ01034815.1.p1  ORF type:complete len:181 (-),score=26.58 GHRQ01034815.1:139-681(-)